MERKRIDATNPRPPDRDPGYLHGVEFADGNVIRHAGVPAGLSAAG